MSAARDEIRDRIHDALWTELEHQAHGSVHFGPCVDPDDNFIEGRVNMDAVADAILKIPGIVIVEVHQVEDFIAAIPDLMSHRFIDSDGYFSVEIHDSREVARRVAAALLAAANTAEQAQDGGNGS